MAQTVKRMPTMRETWVRSLGGEDPLEKEMATHSSTLAWKIPWMEESGRLQSVGSQRVSDFTLNYEGVMKRKGLEEERQIILLLFWWYEYSVAFQSLVQYFHSEYDNLLNIVLDTGNWDELLFLSLRTHSRGNRHDSKLSYYLISDVWHKYGILRIEQLKNWLKAEKIFLGS